MSRSSSFRDIRTTRPRSALSSGRPRSPPTISASVCATTGAASGPGAGPRLRARRRAESVDGFLGLLAALDDIAGAEQNGLELLLPVGGPAQQEFQVHAEVLEFFLERVLHDCLGLLVLLQRDALGVPADRLRLLDQRRDHAGIGAGFVGKLLRRLVILFGGHWLSRNKRQGCRGAGA